MKKLEKQPKHMEEETHRETLVRELKKKLEMAYEMDVTKAHKRVLEFADVIRKKYSDYSECRLWHLLILSTISDNTKITRFDFPGDDSIEKFIKSL